MPTKMKPLPATSLLHELFQYEPDTGKLIWRVSRRGGVKAGMEVGYIRTLPSGHRYRCVGINGQMYYAHRVIWAMHHGECSLNLEIDHINGEGSDNRIINLRLVDMPTNQRNARRQRNNTSGYTGVRYNKATRKWRAEIRFGGKQKYLGEFGTAEEAAEQYRLYAKRFGFHENHGEGRHLRQMEINSERLNEQA